MADDLTLVFVWYRPDGAAVYNTDRFPFWHNIRYHARRYPCVLVYCFDAPGAPPVPAGEEAAGVVAVDFREQWDRRGRIDALQTTASKIDYIKLTIVMNCDRACIATDFVLLMDMDCSVDEVRSDRMASHNRRLEVFFDRSVAKLYDNVGRFEFDSYIENYATLVNRRAPFFQSHHHVVVTSERDTGQNCYMYAQYLNVVHLYYALFHAYTFPPDVRDLVYENSVKLRFRRGASWTDRPRAAVYKYVYDSALEPEFAAQSLDGRLMAAILKGDDDETRRLALELRRLDYDFGSQFDWSNGRQKFANVAGVLVDRRPDFDFDRYQFLLPVRYFSKNKL
ncbi:LdOrf-109 peptide [Lymantria dispar multiple nucleopolyhedrovirus]|uniref:LdOrf-109 peptide n=1 Tax=Lymantria dispar multicapsid nuclear polyhedrosis virus TaxID=10449 RepID=Q9YML8_NPVLD|nr:LdOrf-109 peptide [Lymantria dispar multiple nucleopolyhedrovirus]AAC70295.1 LdOrf-109 peptide [Lymantria dispar multiple nucleopolyhedrovirus]